ncbi:MAG TPA: hypothetical protein VF331_22800 [Polyangiales bacterium]
MKYKVLRTVTCGSRQPQVGHALRMIPARRRNGGRCADGAVSGAWGVSSLRKVGLGCSNTFTNERRPWHDRVRMPDDNQRGAKDAPAWPDHFPVNCPEAGAARPVDEDVFRFHTGDASAWLSYLQQNKKLAKNKMCQGAALSCFLSLADLREVQAVQDRWKSAAVVRARLRPAHGHVKQTGGRGHHSLWLTKDALARAAELFAVVT